MGKAEMRLYIRNIGKEYGMPFDSNDLDNYSYNELKEMVKVVDGYRKRSIDSRGGKY
jgi:hypothetical protein